MIRFAHVAWQAFALARVSQWWLAAFACIRLNVVLVTAVIVSIPAP